MLYNSDLASTKAEFAQASAGMRHPTIVTLKPGTKIIRFGSSGNVKTGAPVPAGNWARGAWWFFEAGYRLICDRYRHGQLNLGTVAQIAGAVQPTWSKMDLRIKANVVGEINVYVGKASTQYREQLPNGMYMTLTGWPDIDQIYIPNMKGNAFAAIQVVKQEILKEAGIAIK